MNAGRHSEFDHMRSVSANIMTGQTGYFGTGAFSLVLNQKEMENQETLMEVKRKQIGDDDIFVDDDDDLCSNINIKNNIDQIKKNKNDVCDDDGYDFGL